MLLSKYNKRNSNIELLRIISMFMILALHANFNALGSPTSNEAVTNPALTFARVCFEQLCIICVNLFVLISGWFSIKTKVKSAASFLFQSYFIITFMYLMGLILGKASFNPDSIMQCFMLQGNAWFVMAYFGLYLLAPFLNGYCEKASKNNLKLILIAFFTFQTIYGCFTTNVIYINKGFSTFSFIGLYLLARYLRLYPSKLKRRPINLYIIFTLGLIIWYWVPLYFGYKNIANMALAYTCPFNILSAVGLVVYFAQMKPRVIPWINYISSSVFAVYLCHICNNWTWNTFKSIFEKAFNEIGLYYIPYCMLIFLLIFIFSICIDFIRKIAWNQISRIKLRKILMQNTPE